MIANYRQPAISLPADIPDGEPFFMMPTNAAMKHDERCVTYTWLSRRELFGEVYRLLLPDYFHAMPQDSGVVIGSFIPTTEVVRGLTFPGDIDILVIPYEGNELVLSYTLAIEIKVIRASFARQGKSPNQFGFSQASALLAAGFPHVAVGHLIASDRSPEHAWREMAMTTVLDANTGTCGPLQPVQHDMLPGDLMDRSHGRLEHNCPDPRLGHFSAYPSGNSLWFPNAAHASFNPKTRPEVLEGIYACYQANHRHFLRTRRYPSSEPVTFSTEERMQWAEVMVEKFHRDFR